MESRLFRAFAGRDVKERQVISFDLPGYDHDVRLKVFDTQEYHVHSAILKIHSAFFRKFHDSADKESLYENSQKFKYEWVTMLDEDETWSLVDSRKAPSQYWEKNPALKEGQRVQELAFYDFIRILYGREWKVDPDGRNLRLVTEIADYYRALPVVSRSLNGALYPCPEKSEKSDFLNQLRNLDLPTFLEAAYKLRHRTLFREAMTLFAGYWPPESKNSKRKHALELGNPKLNELAKRLRAEISEMLIKADQEILSLCASNESAREARAEGEAAYWKLPNDHEPFGVHPGLPAYYFCLAGSMWDTFEAETPGLCRLFIDLDKHSRFDLFQIALDPSLFECYFLSAEINDEDLPWDTTQTDW